MFTCHVIALPYSADPAIYFERIRREPGAIMLDSGRPVATRGRYDILSAWPVETLQPFEGEGGADFLARLRLSLQSLGKAELTGSRDLPFSGGLLGYMAYDFGRLLQPGLRQGLQSDTHSAIADARFGLYDWALISDHEALTTQLVFHPRCSEERRRRVLNVFDESGASEGIPETASAHSMGPPLEAGGFQLLTSFSPSITREAYRQGIERIHRYIQAGDCYQVNYTQRFEARYRGDPWLAYRRLREVCPVPFAGYVGLGGENAILSLSPERFLRLGRGWVEARPIKGTRPRGATPETDELQAQALLNSEKDRAENLMIVDLLRNDIGRVARIGSVRVPELFSLESYPNVHHLVSSVGAELAPGLDAFDLLAASFPGGSITGAPKLRAMQIIDELEARPRSIYCGSLLYIDVRGEMDSSITIRSLLAHEGAMYCWGGGGIVMDSDWEAEYQESLDKVGVLLRTLEGMAPPQPDALNTILEKIPRRYRLNGLPPLDSPRAEDANGHSTTLAVAIEQARRALEEGVEPGSDVKQRFLSALAALIREAMQAEAGDPAIQALVLQHHEPLVREYASLAAQAHGDRRRVQKLIDSVAHPEKLRHTSSPDSAFLTRVHRLAETGAWAELNDTLHRAQGQGRLPAPLLRLLDSPSLHHLVRRAALCALAPVQRYQALRDQMGPPARSEDAVADGSASRQRGAAVEAAAARALHTIADRLNEEGQLGRSAEQPCFYKVVTSMRAPSTLPADHAHAKTEWDVVLLERASVQQLQPADPRESAPAEMPQEGADRHGEPPEAWDIRLLLEAKASVDAPATDLPRLLRGLQLLSQADPAENYVFQTREGPVTLRGATLSALPVEAGELDSVVLYCSDGPEQAAPRLLSAASRMQLLSAPASLAFAARGCPQEDTTALEPVWRELLSEPRWRSVLNQYPALARAMSLMVHTSDLEAAL